MKYLNEKLVSEALMRASKNLKHYTVLNTLLHTGLRATECAKLRVNNIDFDTATISIVGKGNKPRTIFVSPELLLILRTWIKFKGLPFHAPMWKYTRVGLTKMVKRYTGLSAHKMRHTYAINLLKITKDINYVREQLGHSDLSSTQIYLRYTDYSEQNKALSGLYRGSST